MFPMDQGREFPPTDYAIRMRPLFITTLVMLMGIVVGKFVISDHWGAVSLIFVVLMGVLVLSGDHGINATNALFYSVMAMISGIFDVISCMLYFQHSKYKPFEEKTPTLALVAQVIFIISPIALFISASISYSIFSDCRGNESENWPMNNDFDDFRYGQQQYGGAPRQAQQAPGQRAPGQNGPQGGQNNRQPFVAFQGQGRRMENSP